MVLRSVGKGEWVVGW